MASDFFQQRYQCKCGNFLTKHPQDLADIAEFTCNKCHSKGQWKKVPYWYGQDIPSYLALIVAPDLFNEDWFAVIPEFYLENCVYFAGLNGKVISRMEAVYKFRRSVKHAGIADLMVASDEWWFNNVGWALEGNPNHPMYKFHRIIRWQG